MPPPKNCIREGLVPVAWSCAVRALVPVEAQPTNMACNIQGSTLLGRFRQLTGSRGFTEADLCKDLFRIGGLKVGASGHAPRAAPSAHAWACFEALLAISVINLALVGV